MNDAELRLYLRNALEHAAETCDQSRGDLYVDETAIDGRLDTALDGLVHAVQTLLRLGGSAALLQGFEREYAHLELALREPRDRRYYGSAALAAFLDEDDLRQMRDEMADLLTDAESTGSMERLQREMDGWRQTARVMADPVSRDILTGNADPDDFDAVPRPEGGSR